MDGSQALLSPQAWCRRVLMALHERSASVADIGDLPMLLAYFIELDPSPELFAELLNRCANDPRQGVADSARELLQSWERGLVGAEALPLPPLAEVLRTMGALLDASGVRGAYLAVAPNNVRLQTFGERSIIDLGLLELRQEIAAYTALRGQVTAAEAHTTMRHEVRLRAVGAVLDAQPGQSYELAVMPSAIVVEGSAGYARVFRAEELTELVQSAAYQRDGTDHRP